jgi:hypothetical protein
MLDVQTVIDPWVVGDNVIHRFAGKVELCLLILDFNSFAQ